MFAWWRSSRFPRWVEDRFNHRETFSNEKDKRKKRRSAWWNLPQVAVSAKGNEIGIITDLMTSCLAAGRPDLAELLAKELQAALDALKHGTMPNQDVIISVRKQVITAPWLRLKDEKRAGDLPLHLTVSPTDKIGRLYNVTSERTGRLLQRRPASGGLSRSDRQRAIRS